MITKDADKILAISLVALYLALALLTLSGTGITWDENRYIAQSKAKAYSIYAAATGKPDLFFCNITDDFTASSDKFFEGSLKKSDVSEWGERCWEGRARSTGTLSGLIWAGVWYANGTHLDVIASIAAHRLSTVFLTAIGIAVVFLFLLEAYNRRAAVFGTLALIFMPVFFAHSKYMLFDEPSAILWIITIWVFWKSLSNRKYGILFGIVYAVALTTKEQTLFIPVVIAVWLVVSYRSELLGRMRKIQNMNFSSIKPRILGRVPVQIYSLMFLTPLFLFLLWPWLWYKPLERLSWWISYYIFQIQARPESTQFFMGEVLGHTPFYMPLLMLISTIPLVILAFSIMGGFRALKDTLERVKKKYVSLLILLSAIFPVAVLMAISVSYNGVQQSLPAVPFIAMLSGVGADYFIRRAKGFRMLKRMKNREFMLTAILITLFVLPGLIAIAKGHTDAYFSELVGGTPGVYSAGIFETEWSGEAYLQAAQWLSANAKENATVYVPMANNIFNTYKYGDIGQISTRMDVSSGTLGSFSFDQETVIRDDIRIIGIQDTRDDPELLSKVDYVVLMTRLSLFTSDVYVNELSRSCLESEEPVYSVTLDGVPLAMIYETPCS
ncbi:MAG: glycosyltransferase family 39 protein [Candidatus Aenigmatarchaeota archaeon]